MPKSSRAATVFLIMRASALWRRVIVEAGAGRCARRHDVAAGVVLRGIAEQIARANDGDPLGGVAVGGVARQEIAGPAIEEDPGAAVAIRLAVGDHVVAASVIVKYSVDRAVAVVKAVSYRVVAYDVI